MKTFVKNGMGMVETFCGKKRFLRLLVTAAAAFLMMAGAGYVAQLIQGILAYHTWTTFACLFIGTNAFLSRKKLMLIYRKLSAMGNEAQPQVSTANMGEVAREFAEAVNHVEPEEEIED